MGLESGTTIASLNASWPLGTDNRSQGDDHLRLVKSVMKTDAVSKSATGTQALAGNVTISNASPTFTFAESDQTDPAGRYRHVVFDDIYLFQRALTANFATAKTIWNYSGGGSGNFTVVAPLVGSAGISGSLTHVQGGGVMQIGAASGAGYGHLTWTEANKRLAVNAAVGTNATVAASALLAYNGLFADDTDVNTTPKTRLATDNGNIEVGGATAAQITFMRPSSVSYLQVQAGATLQVRNTTPTIWAQINSASGWAAGASDIRLKENVEPIHYGLDTVLALEPIQFDWIEEKRHDIGFAAQDVEKVIPEIVEFWKADPDVEGQIDTLALRKDALTAVLVKAVQELAARVDALGAEVEALKAA